MRETLLQFFSAYPLLAPMVFIILRALAVIIPPIPGLVFDLIGIAAFGPLLGFIYAEIGIMSGAMVAFWLARRFREPLVRRLASLQKLHQWEQKISENKKFWMLVAIRLPTNIGFDYISYAAGFTRIGAVKFFFSTLIGNIPLTAAVYYLGGLSLQRGVYYLLAFIAIVLIWIFVIGSQFYKLILWARKRKK